MAEPELWVRCPEWEVKPSVMGLWCECHGIGARKPVPFDEAVERMMLGFHNPAPTVPALRAEMAHLLRLALGEGS